MVDFVKALMNPDFQFLANALIMGILASISFGIIGTYVVTRRISYLAGAISHAAFGGIGMALYLSRTFDIAWLDPIHGAMVFAVGAAVITGMISIHSREREDTVIGAIWSVGMAMGIVFIDMTPGYFELSSFLFGDILLISSNDIVLITILDVVILGTVMLCYNPLLAVCFDDEYAMLRGINAHGYYIFLLCLTAVTVVLMVRIVGIVMVIALLTLPAAIAGKMTKRMLPMMSLAVFLCMLFDTAGLAVSFVNGISTGPTIILIAGISYLAVMIFYRIRN
ncbi:ABC-type Mn2+/Zn2+ transport system, permease component [Desulfamplus magnetovallimortis]|uniref:ABC-type Mn2+/Zn2+ transport system, permease component n=1 Tax=Desulfamplus magnetovallimortis TaxID=1246637 RepID=A0A1W1H673_9BACT|nr:metal ABC transporter permease [Desulfamplus magnetovallimortis]SLM27952.1 ABC-type Mn2+/Zn2+ transport system, permease component [Desulfamplus magnetovallimortis]